MQPGFENHCLEKEVDDVLKRRVSERVICRKAMGRATPKGDPVYGLMFG